MTHGAMLFRWLQRDAGSAPKGAGRALCGYARLIRSGQNPKEPAKSTGGQVFLDAGSSCPRGKTFAMGSRQGHRIEKIEMFPAPGREWK